MNRAKISVIILSLILLTVCTLGTVRLLSSAESPAYGTSVYDLLTPELISMYEREISLCPIVGNKPEAFLERTAQNLGISTAKLKAVMLLQDLAARLDENVSLSHLAAMSDLELIVYAKERATTYANTLAPERREQLKSMLFAALKS